MHPDDDKVDYALEMAKHQGVSVSTVKDGWVFTITQTMLQALLDKAKENGAGMAVLFVQDSSKIPVTIKN